MHSVRISVRDMVEETLKSGDLSRLSGPINDIMQEAADAHRRLQAQSKLDSSIKYESEIQLKLVLERGGTRFTFTGRADGVYAGEGGAVVLQEIKTTYLPLDDIGEEDFPQYTAQALCYGHMLCERNGLEGLAVEILYAHRDDSETKTIRYDMTAGELEKRFFAVADIFIERTLERIRYQQVRDESLANLAFPFESYRPGQRAMMKVAYQAISDGKTALIQAPTGIGKTAAAVFPALKAVLAGKIDKVFYLTPRTTAALSALELIQSMIAGGLMTRVVRIRAKERACFLDKPECDPEICPYAKGYYDRVDGALGDLMSQPGCYDGVVGEIAETHRVCPYELSLDAALACDIIICDYNYAFDPRVYLRRFFQHKGKNALLIDEAHMLPDRSRMMFSAELSVKPFLMIRRSLSGGRKSELYGATKIVIRAFAEIESGDELTELKPDGLVYDVSMWMEAAARAMPFTGLDAQLLTDAYFAAVQFCFAAERFGPRYRTLVKGGKSSRSVNLLCMDASHELRQVYKKCKAAVMFSATLSPMEYYAGINGCDEDCPKIMLPSPFPRENLFVCNVPLKANYAHREGSALVAASAILSMCRAKNGNYMAFFPSYTYLSLIYNVIEGESGIEIIKQERDLSQQGREDLLDMLSQKPDASRLVMAVLGGVFSQSVDLPGDLLFGAAVVSVGLGQLSPENDAMRDYFAGEGRDGFDYAYRFPGMSKVLQAAGRVIRTPEDRGVILLMDERYSRLDYARLLPPHFHPIPIIKPHALERELVRFWEGRAHDGN